MTSNTRRKRTAGFFFFFLLSSSCLSFRSCSLPADIVTFPFFVPVPVSFPRSACAFPAGGIVTVPFLIPFLNRARLSPPGIIIRLFSSVLRRALSFPAKPVILLVELLLAALQRFPLPLELLTLPGKPLPLFLVLS